MILRQMLRESQRVVAHDMHIQDYLRNNYINAFVRFFVITIDRTGYVTVWARPDEKDLTEYSWNFILYVNTKLTSIKDQNLPTLKSWYVQHCKQPSHSRPRLFDRLKKACFTVCCWHWRMYGATNSLTHAINF